MEANAGGGRFIGTGTRKHAGLYCQFANSNGPKQAGEGSEGKPDRSWAGKNEVQQMEYGHAQKMALHQL